MNEDMKSVIEKYKRDDKPIPLSKVYKMFKKYTFDCDHKEQRISCIIRTLKKNVTIFHNVCSGCGLRMTYVDEKNENFMNRLEKVEREWIRKRKTKLDAE